MANGTREASRADLLGDLLSLAEKALTTGDAAHAERIIGGHLRQLLTEARSSGGADLARVERALKLALAIAEAERGLAPRDRVHLRRVEGLARLLRTG